MDEKFFDLLVILMIGWLVGWLVGWFVSLLVIRFVDSLILISTNKEIYYLIFIDL